MLCLYIKVSKQQTAFLKLKKKKTVRACTNHFLSFDMVSVSHLTFKMLFGARTLFGRSVLGAKANFAATWLSKGIIVVK